MSLSNIQKAGPSLRAAHYLLDRDPPKYATYGLKNQPTAPAFKIEQPAFGMELSQGQLVYFAVQGGRSRDFIAEELRETIQGMPAGGARLVGKKEVAFALFVTPPGQHYAFFWLSDPEYFRQLEGIYRAMVPTIRIELPVK